MTNANMFAGKVALIIGGTSGIGLACARRFLTGGARVAVVGRNTQTGAQAEAQLQQHGEAAFLPVDVSDESAVAALLKNVVARYGRIDCAFNNAGWEGRALPSAEIDQADWQHMLDVKLTGVWRCLKHEVLQLRAQGDGGAIVNMAGTWGLVGFPGYASYCAAAHGIMGLTKAAALEYGVDNIRINAVCPGAVDAPMLDRMVGGNTGLKQEFGSALALGRIATPEDVAGAVAWLCSDDAAYVSGQGLVLDGGGRA